MVQAGARLCLAQKLPVSLTPLSACKAGRPWTAFPCIPVPRLNCHPPVCSLCSLRAVFQQVSLQEMSTDSALSWSWSLGQVCALSHLVFSSHCAFTLALLCVLQDLGNFSMSFLLLPHHHGHGIIEFQNGLCWKDHFVPTRLPWAGQNSPL